MLKHWKRSLLKVCLGALAAIGHAEPPPSADCTTKDNPVACLKCYTDRDNRIFADCFNEFPISSGSDHDPATEKRQNCLHLRGYRNNNTAAFERICENVGAVPEIEEPDRKGTLKQAAKAAAPLPPRRPISPMARDAETPKAIAPRSETQPARSDRQIPPAEVGKAKEPRSITPPSGTDTRPKDPEPAQGDAVLDVSQCENASSLAQNCCANPSSSQCLSSSEQSEISRLSNQALGAGGSGSLSSLSQASASSNDSASSVNSIYGQVCYREKVECKRACAAAQTKYSDLSRNCSGCSSSSIYDQAISRISQATSTCDNLSSSKFAEQSLNNAAGMGQASAANQASSQNKDPQSSANQCQPANSPQCLAQQAQAQAQANAQAEQGQAGFQTASKSKGRFNLPDNADGMMQTPNYAASAGRGDDKNGSPQVKTIANNSGGSIPGQGGSPNGAKLDSNAKKGYVPQTASNVTDIEQGMRSGGYSQPVGPAGNDSGGGDYGGLGRGLASEGGIDLRQYLPGGRRDPNARIGIGGVRPPGTQIHGKYVDLWNRITDRMQEKCRIGELFGCS